MSTYYIPATVLGSGDTTVMDTHRASDLRYNSVGEINRKDGKKKRGECLRLTAAQETVSRYGQKVMALGWKLIGPGAS